MEDADRKRWQLLKALMVEGVNPERRGGSGAMSRPSWEFARC